MENTPSFPSGRPKRYWITEQQRMTQARKSWKTLIDIRDGRIKEQEWDDEKKEMITVAPSVKQVREAATKIMAYAVGMPKQAVEHTGEDGGPISLKWVE